MDLRAFYGKQLLAAVIFVGALLVLAIQLINPSPVMVSIGESGTEANQVGKYFTYSDVTAIVVSSVLGSSSGTYLLLNDTVPADQSDSRAAVSPSTSETTETVQTNISTESDHQDEPNVRLKDNEETIYSLLTEADGELPQRKIVEETTLSKATVSRTLDSLEHKNIVERKRHGIGNLVYLT